MYFWKTGWRSPMVRPYNCLHTDRSCDSVTRLSGQRKWKREFARPKVCSMKILLYGFCLLMVTESEI